jgi:hypothetical protein
MIAEDWREKRRQDMKRGPPPIYSLYAVSSHASDAVDMNAFCTMNPSLYLDQRGAFL